MDENRNRQGEKSKKEIGIYEGHEGIRVNAMQKYKNKKGCSWNPAAFCVGG